MGKGKSSIEQGIRLSLTALLLALTPTAVSAADPQAGDVCASSGDFVWSADPGRLLICDGMTYKQGMEVATTGRSLLQVNDDAGACNSDKLGRLRYDGTTSWSYCNGASWVGLLSGAATLPAAPDRSIQFNNASAFGGDANFVYTTGGNVGIGTATAIAGLDVQRAITAASAVAYGGRYQQTLTAAANSDALTALYINPTFADASKTGVKHNGLIVASGNVGIGTATPSSLLNVSGAGWTSSGGDVMITGSNSIGATLTLNSTGAGGYKYSLVSGGGGSISGFGIWDHVNSNYPLILTPADYHTLQLSSNASSTVGSGLTLSPAAAGGRVFNLISTANGSGSGGGKFTIFDGTAFAFRLTLDSIGNLGVGTTTPLAGLDVQNPITAASAVAYGGRYQQTLTAAANNDALTALYINPTFADASKTGVTHNGLIVANGNVGIGTATPTDKLDVVMNSGANQNGITIHSVGSGGSGSQPAVAIYSNGGTKIGSYASDVATQTMLISADQATAGAGITFFTPVNSEKMRISNTGNVGIGTTSPTNILSLGGTSPRIIWMERNTAAGTAGQGLTLSAGGTKSGNTSMAGGDLTLASGISTGTSGSNILFTTSGAASGTTADDALTERMRITGTGNVGIGDTTPDSGTGGQLKLDVEGPVGGTKYCDEVGNNCFTAAGVAAGSSPGGSTTQIQFNDGGVFGGDADMTWNKTSNVLTVNSSTGNGVVLGGGSATAPSVSFASDSNTGLYSPTSDKVSLATAGTERVRVTATGLSINKAADPVVALDVTGDIEYSGTITDISDARLKTDVKPLAERGLMLARLGRLRPVSFVMKNDPDRNVEFGLIAQDAEDVFPELVKTAADKAGTKSLNYVGLIAPLIAATQELATENAALKVRLDSLDVSHPRNSTDSCTVGQTAHDTDFIYLCVGENTWKRAALSSW